jgi:hypothetical protein
LVPTGDHWRVGLRYACPAAAANQGRALRDHDGDLDAYAAELERQAGIDRNSVAPPALQARQRVDWPDFLRFIHALLVLLRNADDRFECRMRKCLAVAQLCRGARFDHITGMRLVEFLDLVCASVGAEVSVEPAAVAPPTWIGRVLFRQAAAIYARKDHGPDRSQVRSRPALMVAAWRFARGSGAIPRIHGQFSEATFERAEEPTGPLPEAAERVLERYYLVKVGSLQFCGPTCFGLSLWEGFEALALTLPVILWVARALPGLPRTEAVTRAVSMVDNNFGFNRLLGTRRQRFNLAILARRRELEKLIAWYSR